MNILLVSATAAEIAPVVATLSHVCDRGPRLRAYSHRGHELDALTSGVGMVATAAWLAATLARREYDLVLNLGVCGAFDRSIPLGTVVHVVADRLSELGAEDGDGFLTVHDLQLLCDNEFPFTDGELVNHAPPEHDVLRRLTPVRGITVNTVHGCDASIARVVARASPQVETMEGAAFMYACLVHGVRFAQVRAVSNVVERRNRASWKMPEAIGALNAVAREILDRV